MVWTLGDRVTHAAKPDWGVGKIVAVLADGKLRIRFAAVGEKLLKTPPLILVTGSAAVTLPGAAGSAAKKKGGISVSIGEYKVAFLDLFPRGFCDPRYLSGERAYKIAASKMLRKTMARKPLQSLTKRGHCDEVCRLAQAVVSATNLIFPNEKMDLSDALQVEGASQQFSGALSDLLHGTGKFDDRFTAFCAVLAAIGASQWTIATYFSYLAEPDTHMFLKPVATKRIAAACDINLNYRTAPNILTYRSLLRLSERLADELADLKPKDKIDLQSFIWCVAR